MSSIAILLLSIESALQGLVAHKMRSSLTLLGVVIGVAGVLVIDSVAQAQSASVVAQVQRIGSNVVSVSPTAPNVRGVSNGSIGGATLRRDDAASLRQLEHVQAVSAEVTGFQQVANGRRSARTVVTGATPDIQAIQNWSMLRGAFYSARDEVSAAPVVVIGRTVVERLFPDGTNPVGQRVRIRNADLKVIGVLAAKGHDGGSDLDDVVLVPFTTGQQRLYGTARIALLQVQVDRAENIPEVMASIRDALDRSHHLKAGQADDFAVQSYQQLLDRSAAPIDRLTTIMRGIAAAALAMGGFGLMNMLLLGVTERTMEVGLRMAVGARQLDVLAQFLAEAVTLALSGGLLGLGAGVALAAIVPRLLAGITAYAAQPSPLAMLSALGLTLGIGVVFGLYPALRASRLNPIEALRSE